jgi:hypothetical protein
MRGARVQCRGGLLAGAALATILMAAGTAHAVDYTIGDYQISLDTTLSSSVGLRTSNIDEAFVGYQNGGHFPTANADNGDLNFKPGDIVEATQRITTEFQVKKGDSGIFVRATGFYDPIYDNDVDNFRFPLDRAAVRDIGTDFRLLDAYFFSSPELFGHPVDVRIGNQALNWGESTFIQFGINSITPLDVTALRTPGAELRTAFLPIPVIDLKTSVAPDTTIEAFWQPYWTRTRIEPVGSFFGTTDGVADGGTFLNYFSLYPDAPGTEHLVNLLPDANPFGGAIGRSADRHPTGIGEGGVALRKTFPSLDDLELGLYFENYDSRTPFVSFETGSSHIGSLPGPLSVLSANNFTELLGLLHHPVEYGARTYSTTDSYLADYPKNIKLVGFSWNFTGPDGIAIQGEVSHRFDQPVQLAGADLSLGVNAPAICYLAGSALFSAALAPACAAAKADPVIQAAGGIPDFNSPLQGWVRRDVTQWQSTATKLLDPIPSLSINNIALVGEIGFDYVHNFGHLAGLYNASYTTDTNSAFTKSATVDTLAVPGEPGTGQLSTKGLATQFSGAYTLVAIIDMPSVLPYGIGMKPTFSFQHDFVGTSPLGVNVFQANTAAASAGVSFSYLQAWSLGVQYTNHFPIFDGGKFYGLIDRDFVSATLSYEF